ncbi:MAG: lysophospholipid acyltransferase family protein [Steroidobacteraceae bacterium]
MEPKTRLVMKASGLTARLRLAFRTGPRLRRWLRELAATPDAANHADCARLQRLAARRVLAEFRVRLRIRPPSASTSERLRSQPHIVIALHEGIADVPCLMSLPVPLRFVARSEIFRWPLVGPVLARMGHIECDPESPLAGWRRLQQEVPKAVASGHSVAMFPQGTLLGIESAFRCGAFRLAQRFSLPLLPVVLTGTHRIWEHPFGSTIRYDQRVAMHVLDSVWIPGGRRDAAEDACRNLQQRMKALALASGDAPPRRYVPQRDGYWDGFAFDIDPQFRALWQDIHLRRRQQART